MILRALKENQAGARVASSCRKYGMSESIFYKWRNRLGGLEVSEAKRLKSLEAENTRLKKLLREIVMDVSTLQEMLGKNF